MILIKSDHTVDSIFITVLETDSYIFFGTW